MTDTSVSYRLRLQTEDGFINRFISVDTRDGTILLVDGHTKTIAPNNGLLTRKSNDVGTTFRERDKHTQFADWDAAQAAAKALYHEYLGEGYVEVNAG